MRSVGCTFRETAYDAETTCSTSNVKLSRRPMLRCSSAPGGGSGVQGEADGGKNAWARDKDLARSHVAVTTGNRRAAVRRHACLRLKTQVQLIGRLMLLSQRTTGENELRLFVPRKLRLTTTTDDNPSSYHP